MKYGQYAILALFLPGGVATAGDGVLGLTSTGTVQVSLYIPAQFEASSTNGKVCVHSSGAGPYGIAPQATSSSSSSSANHCIAMDEIHVHEGKPLTLWVVPE